MAYNSNTILIIVCIILCLIILNRVRKRYFLRLFPRPDLEQKILALEEKIIDGLRREQKVDNELRVMQKGEQLLRVGSWKWDLTTKPDVVVFSENFARIFHVEFGKPMTAKQLIEIIHIEDREKVNDILFNSFESGEPYEIEYRIVMRNERVDIIKAQGEPIQNENKKTIGINGVVTLIQRNVG